MVSGATAVTGTQAIDSRPTVRRKFAKPPVKLACLACRASRTRCDGQDPCANCQNRKRKCSYTPSKRGGPRKKKRASPPVEVAIQEDNVENPTIIPASPGLEESALFGQIDVLSNPGAGLRSLDFTSDFQSLFAGLFAPNDSGNTTDSHIEPTPSLTSSSVSSPSMVRAYGSEHDMWVVPLKAKGCANRELRLNAYYDFIHNYFPILPPRVAPASADTPLDGIGSYSESPSEEPIIVYQPRSPLSLAISAILALIPHPNDPEPLSPGSVIRRRMFAHTFAQMANASIESDCELHAFPTNPFEAPSRNRPRINRTFFHPQTPVELESILALLLLTVYEYTQRGNLLKMRYRAGQALAIALDMSLHTLGEQYDEMAEARRRAWWMTYYCVLQGSIVSTTPLSIDANDPQFVTPYPRFATDADGWAILIQSQQVLVAATQFVIDVKKWVPTRTNMPYIAESMQRLDSWASALLAQTSLPVSSASSVSGGVPEQTTTQSIRAIARIKTSSAQIKIHRFRAFSDIPIFLKRHCDLTEANASDDLLSENTSKSPDHPDEISSSSGGCSCTSSDKFQQSSSSETSSSASPELQTLPHYPFISEFPFTSQHSARVCLKAALLISHMFEILPIPQPLSDPNNPPRVLQSLPRNRYPRTMPSFACCMMQGSYALLMIFYQASLAKNAQAESGTNSQDNDSLVEELRHGLERIITAASNFAVSYEALNGMRDDIEGAYQTAFLQG
ncbi:uncharacterized protein DSM5745_10084 [Aspergillus mulundensis]|uniref:Zn(2)-C6 fungal-type domain-containing protein n=1 Tax=Aspergillus mulundensis TaxID=1810919 RepID=A0A3D8QMB5_9EURO|nr:Uncharacterized protein DSM5745_10084 [Aspergillus mulundensis]RDW62973.1 Uncharacterized protein DSM5745_10084 [Aspergillus mulundensis]